MLHQCQWETDDMYQSKKGLLKEIRRVETKALAAFNSHLCHTIESNKQNNMVPKQLNAFLQM